MATLPGIEDEGPRIVRHAAASGIPLRLLGGVAIHAHASRGLPLVLRRSYGDIDLVTLRGKGGEVQTLMTSCGYEPNMSFNTLNGADRMIFYDRDHRRQVDLFIGSFRMCHEIPIPRDRFERDPMTLPLAELLLTKLQIVSVNEKDLRDIFAIVHEHDVREDDDDAINARVIALALSGDWGLWRTSQITIERSRAFLPDVDLPAVSRRLIDERLVRLWDHVEAQSKSIRWRGRSRVGDRMRWYEEPDEIAHAQL
jgi:hypothetical protein